MEKLENKKILVVDDERFIHPLMERIAKIAGDYEVSHAYNGQEGIDRYKQNNHDLIFMDNDMPIKNGLEASLEIKNEAEKNQHNVKIVLMSGRLTKESIPEQYKRYIDYCMPKPWQIHDVAKIIKEVY